MPRLRPHPSLRTLAQVLTVVGLGAGVVALVAGRLSVARWLLLHALPLAGLPGLQAQVTRLDFDHIMIEHAATLDGTLGWERLGARFENFSLTDLVVEGPRVRVFPLDTSGSSLALPFSLPGRRITLRDAQILVFTDPAQAPALTVTVQGEAQTVDAGTGLAVQTFEATVDPATSAGFGAWRLTAPLALRLAAPITLRLTESAPPAQADTTLTTGPLRLATPHGPVSAPAVRLTLIPPNPPAPWPTLRLSLPTLTGLDAEAEAVNADLHVSASGPRLDLSARVTRLPGEATPRPATRPLILTGQGTRSDSGAFDFAGDLGPEKSPVRLSFKGTVAEDGETGRLTLIDTTVPLGPEGLSASDIHTTLKPLIDLTQGNLRISGTLDWGGATGLRPDLRLALRGVSGTVSGIPVEGLSAATRFDQLWPLRSPAFEARVASLSLGLPLTEGRLHLRFDGQGNLRIEDAHFLLAGGRVTALPHRIPLRGGAFRTILEVENLSLAEVAQWTALEGLDASGRLHGRIPLHIGTGPLRFEDARLTSHEPGFLRYRFQPSTRPSAPGADLLLTTLDNFQYKTLTVTLNGPLDKTLHLGLSIQGANPDLYDGYPIDLNVTLQGALSDLILQNLRTLTLPQRLQEALPSLLQ